MASNFDRGKNLPILPNKSVEIMISDDPGPNVSAASAGVSGNVSGAPENEENLRIPDEVKTPQVSVCEGAGVGGQWLLVGGKRRGLGAIVPPCASEKPPLSKPRPGASEGASRCKENAGGVGSVKIPVTCKSTLPTTAPCVDVDRVELGCASPVPGTLLAKTPAGTVRSEISNSKVFSKPRKARWSAKEKKENKTRSTAQSGVEMPKGQEIKSTSNSGSEIKSTSKRPLSPGKTPPSDKQAVKRTKTLKKTATGTSTNASKATFAEVVGERGLRVIVGSDDLSAFLVDNEQAEMLQEVITSEIFNVEEGNFSPKFRGAGITARGSDDRGYFAITCNDIESKRWLEDCVCRIKAPWEGAKLAVCEWNKIPKYTKVTLWIPGKSKIPIANIQERLRKQNRELEVERWRLFLRKDEDPNGTLLVLGLDQTSVDSLLAKNSKVYYGLQELAAKIKPKKDATSEVGKEYAEETEADDSTLTNLNDTVIDLRSEAGNKYAEEDAAAEGMQ